MSKVIMDAVRRRLSRTPEKNEAADDVDDASRDDATPDASGRGLDVMDIFKSHPSLAIGGSVGRNTWLGRWLKNKLVENDGAALDLADPPQGRLPRRESEPPSPMRNRKSCMRVPDSTRKPAGSVTFQLPPTVIVVRREDLCFSRMDATTETDDDDSSKRSRFDLSAFIDSVNKEQAKT
ncbi:Uncharacterized protein PBTT_05292 [Plasmodiophora brassicae]